MWIVHEEYCKGHDQTATYASASVLCRQISIFSTKTYIEGAHEKYLTKALLMNTHNYLFHGKTRKSNYRIYPFKLTVKLSNFWVFHL